MSTSIVEYTLNNQNNDRICVINYGARITKWHTYIEKQNRNIVLGYSDVNDYLTDPYFLGAIAGPYANRIEGAQFKLDKQTIMLNNNEGKNQLHGGNNALSNLFWQLDYCTADTLSLYLDLPDGYNGYPGNTRFMVNYKLSVNEVNETALTINCSIKSDKNTLAGPTSHPYFNLAGTTNSCVGHQLKLFANQYTPVDEKSIPTGEIHTTLNTRFDFTSTKTLNNKIDKLDHNFVCDTELSLTSVKPMALLTSPDKAVRLEVQSNYPAIQVYTGQHLNQPFNPFDGICLEPQFCPNSPNQNNFPFQFVRANQSLNTNIVYVLKK